MSPTTTDLLQGPLDLLILKTLSLGPQHRWGAAQRIQQMSRDLLQINEGSLYPAGLIQPAVLRCQPWSN